MKARPPAWLTDEDQQFYSRFQTSEQRETFFLIGRFVNHPNAERQYKAFLKLRDNACVALGNDGKESDYYRERSCLLIHLTRIQNQIAYLSGTNPNNKKVSELVAKLKPQINQLKAVMDEAGYFFPALELLPGLQGYFYGLEYAMARQDGLHSGAEDTGETDGRVFEQAGKEFYSIANTYEQDVSAFDTIKTLLDSCDSVMNQSRQDYKVNGRAPSNRTLAIRATTFTLLDEYAFGDPDTLPQILEGVPYISLIGFIAGLHAHKKPMEYAEAKDEILKAVDIWKDKETRLELPPVPNF